MHILLVEDDPKLAGLIQKGFLSEHINLEVAYDGLLGKRLLDQRKYDAIILDVNLPGINGFDLCKYVKENWSQTPVMLLTALEKIQDNASGFYDGADDYLTKPFEFPELLLRIKTLARKGNTIPAINRVLKVSDLCMNTEKQVVTRGDHNIELTKREYDLLQYLMLNKGKVVSRIDILAKVWDLNFEKSTNVIDVYINYLRRKIDKNFREKLLHTVVGRGYSLHE